ncbi:MAG: CHC2 zinc finger domain-containing protein [Thermoflexaceae bacterium]|nr:CHC2 zinc finger domain-containing protein [Thermoflexaceae bacterium]
MMSEEIKQQYSMRDIVERYGLHPNRSGFIHCPFHAEDKGASMKIYERDYHCFGCGANGDIFSFIQKMENCDFKTAFYSLGGSYEKPTFESKLSVYKQRKREQERRNKRVKDEKERKLNNDLISIYRRYIDQSEPFSNVWCDCYNALQYQLYLHEILQEESDMEKR